MALKRRRFAGRRKAVGYTQEGLAEALGIERTTVVRWEAAETEPQPWVRPKLAGLLKVTLEGLAELLGDVTEVPDDDGRLVVSNVPLDFSLASRQTVRVIEGFSAHDIASRQVLAGLSVLGGAALLRPVRQWAASLPASSERRAEQGPDEVAELEQAVRLFRQWDASGVGGLRRKAVVGQLNAVAEMLRDNYPPATVRRLFQITAELAQLAGWMAYDQGFAGIAQRYYLLALHACREAACPELGAKVVGDMTQLSTALGTYDDSLQLIHAALYSLPRQETALVRSELLGLESRAYAQFGRREAANAVRSAEACVEVYNEAAHEPVPDWMHYIKQAEVDCLAANAYIELALSADDRPRRTAYAERAQTHTLSACRTRTNGYTRSRVFDEIRLAKVRLAQDEPVESAMVAVGCLERAEHLRSNIVVEWFIRFNHRLTSQYPTVPEATAFRQQLREYVRRAAPQREREVVGSATV